jgi:drug/metabolite transporter (DMT)-like permease
MWSKRPRLAGFGWLARCLVTHIDACRIALGPFVLGRSPKERQESAMFAQCFGPGLVLLFALSQAFRDVYFAHVFQGIGVFTVILLAFAISTLIFGAVALVRAPAGLRAMRREWRVMLWMNATTALAWICYFSSLKHLQPSIVNTLHSGVGPLTVLVLSGLGLNIATPSRVRPVEYLCYAGLAGSLAFLWWVVLAGHSGLHAESMLTSLAGLVLLVVSGASITISLLLSKRLNDRGIGADAITAGRYLLIIAVALAVVLSGNGPSGVGSLPEFQMLALAATMLIVLPLYSLQLGTAHTAALTAHVIRSLGPVFVFALELADGRIGYSGFAFAGIALYSMFAIAANLVRGWGDANGVGVAVRPSATA